MTVIMNYCLHYFLSALGVVVFTVLLFLLLCKLEYIAVQGGDGNIHSTNLI